MSDEDSISESDSSTTKESKSSETSVNSDVQKYIKQGVKYLAQRNFTKSLESYQKALTFSSDHSVQSKVHCKLGNLYCIHLKDFDSAEKSFLEAISLSPLDSSLYNTLATFYQYRLLKYNKAKIYFKKAIKVDPNNSVFYNNIGVLYEDHIKNFERAKMYYQKALELDPSNPVRYFNLALLFDEKIGDKKSALQYYKKVVKLKPDDVNANNNLAILYEEEFKNYRKARVYYQKTIELDPGNVDRYYDLGVLYRDHLGNFKKARQCFKKCVSINPKKALYYKEIGRIYSEDIKDYGKAIKYYDKVLQIHKKDTEILMQEIIIYQNHLNDYNRAKKIYKILKRIDDEYIDVDLGNFLGLKNFKILQDPNKYYSNMKKFDEGCLGVVYKGIQNLTGVVTAIKKVEMADDMINDIYNEVSTMSELDHKNIVQYKASYIHEGSMYIIMEFLDGGKLTDVLLKHTFNEPQIAAICKEVLEALKYMHKKGVLYRDVKSDNILIDRKGNIKICDFGWCVKLQNLDEKRKSIIGTPYWMAPEVIKGIEYSYEADIWSVGITLIELADGKPPLFHETDQIKAMKKIAQGPPPGLKYPEKWSANMNDFLERMLTRNERDTAEELLQHPFIESACSTDFIIDLLEKHKPKK